MNPIEIWNAYYPYVESIGYEQETLDVIRQSRETRDVITGHTASISAVLEKISSEIADKYRSWALDSASYNFGSEAYYQGRILATIRNLQDTTFRLGPEADVLCARQILNPSAFNGSPRIKRVSNVAFLIFPAPTVFWMYAIFEMIAAFMGHGHFDRPRVGEYLKYLIAARTFERWATANTAYAIDFLVDELVHSGKLPSAGISGISPLSVNLVGAAEHFIICHEMAHFTLGHADEGNIDVEAAADRRAIEMLLAVDPTTLVSVECPGLDNEIIPLLGYLALRLWTNIRLAAEMRVLPFVLDTPEEVALRKEAFSRIFDDRAAQLHRAEIFGTMSTAPILKAATEAAHQVIREILEYPIDRNEMNEMRRLAKTLASGEYDVLSPRMFSEARKRRAEGDS
jgi:hypothetical protein